MKSRQDALADEACQWVEKAEHDLTAAAATLKLGRRSPTDTVCFHAQQCVEKYFKAALVANGIDFPKTHDLSRIARLFPDLLMPLLTETDRKLLTDYATFMRYPGDYEPITLQDARHAVALARRVRAAIRKVLPQRAKTRP
jgi:HEPN domain-containing protein